MFCCRQENKKTRISWTILFPSWSTSLTYWQLLLELKLAHMRINTVRNVNRYPTRFIRNMENKTWEKRQLGTNDVCGSRNRQTDVKGHPDRHRQCRVMIVQQLRQWREGEKDSSMQVLARQAWDAQCGSSRTSQAALARSVSVVCLPVPSGPKYRNLARYHPSIYHSLSRRHFDRKNAFIIGITYIQAKRTVWTDTSGWKSMED